MKVIKLNVTLRQLRAFVLVDHHGSYSAAAESLSMTQGALSHLISELERQTGFKVFERTTRKLALTPEGTRYLRQAEKVLAEMQKLNEVGKQLLHQKRSQFLLGSTAALIASELPSILHDFSAKYPDIRVELKDYQPDELMEAVDGREVELAIGPRRGDLPVTVQEDHMFSSPVILVVSRDHPFTQLPQVRWEQLHDQALVFHDKRSVLQVRKDSGFDFSANRVIELSQLHSILSVVESAEGVTIVAAYAMRYLSVHKVVALPLVEPEVVMHVGVYKKRDHTLSDSARVFHDFILRNSLCANADDSMH